MDTSPSEAVLNRASMYEALQLKISNAKKLLDHGKIEPGMMSTYQRFLELANQTKELLMAERMDMDILVATLSNCNKMYFAIEASSTTIRVSCDKSKVVM